MEVFRVLKPNVGQASNSVLALGSDQKIAELITWHCSVVKNMKTTGSIPINITPVVGLKPVVDPCVFR